MRKAELIANLAFFPGIAVTGILIAIFLPRPLLLMPFLPLILILGVVLFIRFVGR